MPTHHTVEIVPVEPQHIPELSRICFEAFGTLHDRHNTPRDFDSLETARIVLGMIAGDPAYTGFAAMLDGRLVGSNFIGFADPVAGVGPITVDPACQARGVGRALMQSVLNEAARRGVQRVRLMQEAINATSLSLYTSLGFQWQDSVAVVQAAPAGSTHGIRPMTGADLAAVDAISRRHYGHTRRAEVETALSRQLPAFVRQSELDVQAYLLPGFLGHGFAPSDSDMADLVSYAASHAPPPFQRVLVPLSQPDLFRELLRRGCRTVKVLSYMAVGPFEKPRGAWLPSIQN